MNAAARIRDLYPWLALLCAAVVVFYPATPASRYHLPWPFILAFGAGTGLALGGVRVGKGVSRADAIVALIVLLGMLTLLIGHRLVFRQD